MIKMTGETRLQDIIWIWDSVSYLFCLYKQMILQKHAVRF